MNDGMYYLASPYMHEDARVRQWRYEMALRHAAKLLNEGTHVLSPIVHSHNIALMYDLPKDWTFWKPIDYAYIAASRGVIVLKLPGWTESEGITAETKIARDLGRPVQFGDPDPFDQEDSLDYYLCVIGDKLGQTPPTVARPLQESCHDGED